MVQPPRTLEGVLGVRDEGGAGCAAVEQLQAEVLPLEFLAESGDPSLTNWTITGWWHRGHYYGSVADMAAAAVAADADAALTDDGVPTAADTAADRSPSPAPPPAPQDLIAPCPGPKCGADQPLGPLPHEPYGRRFTLSSATSPRVEWLGWEVTVGYKATSGPRFWDVRFKGERIAYELALQEISCGETQRKRGEGGVGGFVFGSDGGSVFWLRQ